MKPILVKFDAQQTEARFTATHMPRLEFRQALFKTSDPRWQRRLYPASLVVTTTAFDPDGRTLITDHQAMRFSLLYNATWPEPVFLRITRWHYRPLLLRKDIAVGGYLVEMRLRDLRLGPDERVDVVLLG